VGAQTRLLAFGYTQHHHSDKNQSSKNQIKRVIIQKNEINSKIVKGLIAAH
jgi:hypothetical protein